MQIMLSPAGRSLVVTGAALFLAGLVQGAVIDLHANPRMALSAHLDAVQSGMAVMIAGILWSSARLGERMEATARWALAVRSALLPDFQKHHLKMHRHHSLRNSWLRHQTACPSSGQTAMAL